MAMFRELLAVLALAILVFFLQGPAGYVLDLGQQLWDTEDTLGNVWTLDWIARAAFDPEVSVWDAPIFYPLPNALAYTESHLGNLWLYWPVWRLSGNPTLAANLFILASFVLCAAALFLLLRELGVGFLFSLAGALLFAFHPYRWWQLPRLQLISFFWTPLCLVYMLRWFRTGRARSWFGAAACLALQTYTSVNLGLMLIVLGSVLLLTRLFDARARGVSLRQLALPTGLPILGLSALLALASVAPLALRHLSVMREHGLERTLNEAAIGSADLGGFLVPASGPATFPDTIFRSYNGLPKLLERMQQSSTFGGGETGVFPGLLLPTLALLGLIVLFLRRDRKTEGPPTPLAPPTDLRREFVHFIFYGLVMASLMLGPWSRTFSNEWRIPLPYQLLYHFMPGASVLRYPARFMQPLLLCLCIAGALSLALLAQRYRMGRRGQVILVLLVGAFGFIDYRIGGGQTFALGPDHPPPAIYRYLAQNPRGGAVLELPIRPVIQLHYLIYQHLHRRPKIDGMASFLPNDFNMLVDRFRGCPSADCIQAIAQTKARTVVFHLNHVLPRPIEPFIEMDPSPYGFRKQLLEPFLLVWEREEPTPGSENMAQGPFPFGPQAPKPEKAR